MRFYIVDVFTEQTFGGNPAGIVILPENGNYPAEDMMIKVAGELRYSETVFVQRLESNRLGFRYFTPTEEVDLCGHGTLGAFYALRDEGMIGDNCTYIAETAAGDLNVDLKDRMVMMDMATPESIKIIQDNKDIRELYKVMGIGGNSPRVSLEGEWDLYPEIISTGLPDIILPVENKETLKKIKPDYRTLSVLSKKYGVVGVHAFTLGEGLIGNTCCQGACDQSQATAYCRNFAPSVGIDEEAATGTANGALTYYLYKNSLIDAGSGCRFIQGESMGRPSVILGTIDNGAFDVIIRIGGTCAILARGEIDI